MTEPRPRPPTKQTPALPLLAGLTLFFFGLRAGNRWAMGVGLALAAMAGLIGYARTPA